MFILRPLLVCAWLCCFSAENISFKNVTFYGYSGFTLKFKKVIISSSSLKNELPNTVFDVIEMNKQHIPVLYENCITDIDALSELTLENNSIEEIQPGSMKNLSRIREINLKGNKLKTIQAGVFNDLPVSVIDLSKNEISVIESNAFDNMQYLLIIRLTNNKITKWNKNWFANTPSITMVSFQHNEIKELPSEAFKNVMAVEQYQRLPVTLDMFFSYNKIKTVHPDAFTGHKDLNNLWLNNNLIEELPEKLLDGVSVEHLKLNSNKLTCIKDKDALLKAEKNDIDGNPFQCKCLEDIKTWAEKNNKTITFVYSDMNCYANRQERKIGNL